MDLELSWVGSRIEKTGAGERYHSQGMQMQGKGSDLIILHICFS
jgi:hypothetical protein